MNFRSWLLELYKYCRSNLVNSEKKQEFVIIGLSGKFVILKENWNAEDLNF